MNILINSYAVSPSWGSEPGMGWNWISNLAKYANLYIITEGEWQAEIEEAVSKHPYQEHLHFFYLPVSDKIRQMCWNQGDWRFYYYYEKWQKHALKKAEEIIDEHDIDVIHQLNMVGFREPGYLWTINKPLVWGPIGGMTELPKAFIKDAPRSLRLKLSIKNLLSDIQFRFSNRIDSAFRKSDIIIAAVPAVQDKVRVVKHRDSILINETGCYDLVTPIIDKRQRNEFHILWVGRFIYTKRLDIALETIAQVKSLNLKFHIAGTDVNEKVVEHYHQLAKQLGIDSICIWHGKIANKDVHSLMRDCDLFFFTSVMEATSTVVPEAINNCLPIVCFNTCGFGPLVTNDIGRKIPLTTPEESVKMFAEQIRTLYHDRELLHQMSLNCKKELQKLLWENKAKQVNEIYKELMRNGRST